VQINETNRWGAAKYYFYPLSKAGSRSGQGRSHDWPGQQQRCSCPLNRADNSYFTAGLIFLIGGLLEILISPSTQTSETTGCSPRFRPALRPEFPEQVAEEAEEEFSVGGGKV
jgi:hypothetical protein